MSKRMVLVLLAIGLGLSTNALAAPKGAVLEAQGVALNAAGKTHEAGDAYEAAAKAYSAEGNQGAAAKAYGKASELFEKEAAALLKELDKPKVARPALPAHPAPPTTLAAPVTASIKSVTLPPLMPKADHIVGRVIDEMGGTVPNFTIKYSGFEDGKPIYNHMENVGADVKCGGGTFAIKVPPGAYRVSAYVTYVYHGRTYNFEAEPLNPPTKHDFNSLGLDYLKRGLVRDFVLKMTAKKTGASEETESVYRNAYYGGLLYFDCGQVERILGGGHTFTPPLAGVVGTAYPPDSRLQITLTPQGAMVDGSAGHIFIADLRLGDSGTYQFCKRGIFPGVYSATALLKTPTGETVPLRLSLTRARTILKGSADGYDMLVMDWKPSLTVDFLPSDIGPIPRYGVKAIELFLGK